MKKTLLTLALTAAGIAAVTAAQAQPVPAPPPGPAAPAPTATTDPNAPPAAPPPVAPAPTATTTAAPTAPPAAGVPGAQPVDPNAPPAPPPPAPPPVAAPVAPTPAPVYVPPPVAPVTWGAPPPAATPAAPAKKKELSLLDRFAGSQVGWNHSVTTTYLGLGGSCAESVCTPESGGGTFIGHEDDSYTQSLSFVPAFMIYRGTTHTIRAISSISIATEITNGSTSTEREPDVFDIPIRIADTIALASWGSSGDGSASTSTGALARDPTLAGAAEYRTQLLVNGGVILPVSRASRGGGMYLTSSFGVGIRQQIKLLGSASDYLGNITLTLSERWDHQFWKSYTRVNDDLNRPRMTAGGGVILSDQLTGGATVENRLIHNLSFFLPVYGDLQLSGLFQVWNDLPRQFNGDPCTAELLTGCVPAGDSDSKLRTSTQFDVSLYYQFSPELGADLGYNNFAGQIGEGGKTRNPFYSPGSIFYADISIFPDQLIKRFTAPKPATQVGSR